MQKPTLSSYIRDNLDKIEKKEPGPFVTISRQYGCDGYELGDLLVKKLNDREGDGKWRAFKKELLKQLAADAGLAEEVVEKERLSKRTSSWSTRAIISRGQPSWRGGS